VIRISRKWQWAGLLAPLAVAMLGCAVASRRPDRNNMAASSTVSRPAVAENHATATDPAGSAARTDDASPGVSRAAYDERQAAPLSKAAARGGDPRYAASGEGVLELDLLIREVEAVNPSLEAAAEAWHAAAFRYPQMISLDDPMFGFFKGTQDGFMVEASQKIPWPGKLRLRGNMASAEASAMEWEVADTRLMLAEAAAMAFFDYYQADRQLAVNAANSRLMQEFRDIAKVRYEAGQVSQQDVLQADVELADLEARRAELQRERKIAAVRINTLLHREAEHPLPPPPEKVGVPAALPAGGALVELALDARPDLAAQMARIRQEEYALGLAYKEYYPDVDLAAKYDGFMPVEMRTQVGANVNVPVYRQKRRAAVCEASANVRKRRAELENRIDQVRYEVQAGWERATERGKVVRLYEERILPASQANVDSARINYTAGKVDFLRLVEAERQLRDQQDKYYETVGEYHRRLAQLERATGGALSR